MLGHFLVEINKELAKRGQDKISLVEADRLELIAKIWEGVALQRIAQGCNVRLGTLGTFKLSYRSGRMTLVDGKPVEEKGLWRLSFSMCVDAQKILTDMTEGKQNVRA